MEWDEVCTLATAAYNFLPNEHSRESPFFIMFGHDPRLPLTELFQHKLRYLGTDETVLSLQALRNMYLVIAENLRKARERSTTPYPKKTTPIQQNQLVTLKVHIRKTLDPRDLQGHTHKRKPSRACPEWDSCTNQVGTHFPFETIATSR